MEELLSEFARIARPGPFNAPDCHHFPGSDPAAQHIVLGFVVHGNEHGTIAAALRLLRELEAGILEPKGAVTLFLGNVEAVRRDVRFIDEDLNRVFTFDRDPDTHERRRALELRPILDAADVFVDFHQTQTPTSSAFWTFPWDNRFAAWARICQVAPFGLTRAAGMAFSQGKCCLDEYVRARGQVGITVEVGTRGEDPRQAEAAYQAARRLLEARDLLSGGEQTLHQIASVSPEIVWFETAEVATHLGPRHRLKSGLENWTPVSLGDLLSPEGAPEIVASCTGRLLFPKYPAVGEQAPPELYRIGRRLEDPELFYGRQTPAGALPQ